MRLGIHALILSVVLILGVACSVDMPSVVVHAQDKDKRVLPDEMINEFDAMILQIEQLMQQRKFKEADGVKRHLDHKLKAIQEKYGTLADWYLVAALAEKAFQRRDEELKHFREAMSAEGNRGKAYYFMAMNNYEEKKHEDTTHKLLWHAYHEDPVRFYEPFLQHMIGTRGNEEAYEFSRKEVERLSDSPLHVYHIAMMAQQTKRYKIAAEQFERLHKAKPDDMDLKLKTAEAFLLTGQYEKALKIYEKLTRLQLQSLPIWSGHMVSLYGLGRKQEAEQYYKKLYEMRHKGHIGGETFVREIIVMPKVMVVATEAFWINEEQPVKHVFEIFVINDKEQGELLGTMVTTLDPKARQAAIDEGLLKADEPIGVLRTYNAKGKETGRQIYGTFPKDMYWGVRALIMKRLE